MSLPICRFFEELDYVAEGRNGEVFAAHMAKDLPQVCIHVSCLLLTWPRTCPGLDSSVLLCVGRALIDIPAHSVLLYAEGRGGEGLVAAY